MNRDQRSSSNDPTAERAVDQSTQSASGLSSPTGPDANDRRPESGLPRECHARPMRLRGGSVNGP